MYAIFCNGGFVQAAWGRVGCELFITGKGKQAALPVPKAAAAQVLKRVRSYGQAAWLVKYEALNLSECQGKQPSAENKAEIKSLVRSIMDVAYNPQGTRSNADMSAGILGAVASVLQWLFEQEFFALSGELPIVESAQELQAHRQAVELFQHFLKTRGQLIDRLQASEKLWRVEVAA